jgi:hypothetical protein
MPGRTRGFAGKSGPFSPAKTAALSRGGAGVAMRISGKMKGIGA